MAPPALYGGTPRQRSFGSTASVNTSKSSPQLVSGGPNETGVKRRSSPGSDVQVPWTFGVTERDRQ